MKIYIISYIGTSFGSRVEVKTTLKAAKERLDEIRDEAMEQFDGDDDIVEHPCQNGFHIHDEFNTNETHAWITAVDVPGIAPTASHESHK